MYVPLTDEGVHRIRGAAHNHADANEGGTQNGDITTTDQVRQRSDEWTNTCESEEVCKNLLCHYLLVCDMVIRLDDILTNQIQRSAPPMDP